MSYRKLYVCTQCHEFWSSGKEAAACPACGSAVVPVEQDYEEYAAWTAEEKAAFKARYVQQHDLTPPTGAAARTMEQTVEAVEDEQFWINSLNTVLNISLCLFLLAAVVVFFACAVQGGWSVLVGLLAAAGLVAAGFLSVAALKIFIGMAKDLKAIRQKLDA